MLIDSHAHLDAVESVEAAIERARLQRVGQVIAVGMDTASNRKTLELAARFPEIVYPAIGYHPWSILEKDIPQTLSFIHKHIDGCVALGEVGLDYKVKVKKPLQQKVFADLLDLAKAREKPVIVHARFSHERAHQMVSAAGIRKAVFHWYSGPLEILDRILTDGYFVSATPALAFSPPHQAAIKKTLLERILIETDSPVMYQGKISEPAHLTDTLCALSRVKDLPEYELARITSENARRFFSI